MSGWNYKTALAFKPKIGFQCVFSELKIVFSLQQLRKTNKRVLIIRAIKLSNAKKSKSILKSTMIYFLTSLKDRNFLAETIIKEIFIASKNSY